MSVGKPRIIYIKRSAFIENHINQDNLARAVKNLDGSSLKLWLYLC